MRWLRPSVQARAAVGAVVPAALRRRFGLRLVLALAVVSTVLQVVAGVAWAAPQEPVNHDICGERGSGGNICADDNPHLQERQRQEDEAEQAEEVDPYEEFERLVAERRESQALGRGVLSALDVRDRDGNPVSTYQVYASTGGWTAWDLKVQNFLVQGAFTGIVWAISFASWVIVWALTFSLARLLLAPVVQISDSLHANLILQMGLPGLFLAVAAVVAAWHWMFGVRARGWGEATASVVIAALAIGVLAAPAHLILDEQDGVIGKAREAALLVATLTLDPRPAPDLGNIATPEDWEQHQAEQSRTPSLPNAPLELSRPITDALVDAFVVKPSQLLSYGQTFSGVCEQRFRDARVAQNVYEDLLEGERRDSKDPVGRWVEDQVGKIPGVGGFLTDWLDSRPDLLPGADTTGDWEDLLGAGPIKTFEEDCLDGPASLAKRASVDKVAGAVFMLLATFLVVAFIVMVVGSFLVAQFWLAIEAVLSQVALAVGILPGPGRAWLWARAASILRACLRMVVSVGALGVTVHIVDVLISADDDMIPGGVVVRFIIIDFAVIAGFVLRRRLMGTAQALARRARDRVANSNFGGQSLTNPHDTTGGRSGLGVGRVVGLGMLAAGAATGGGTSAVRWATRAGLRATRGTAAGTVQAAGVMARGAAIGGRGAQSAARAAFTGPGRSAVRARVAGSVGLPPHVPGDVGALRERMNRMRREREAPRTSPVGRVNRQHPDLGRAQGPAARRSGSGSAAGSAAAPVSGRRGAGGGRHADLQRRAHRIAERQAAVEQERAAAAGQGARPRPARTRGTASTSPRRARRGGRR